MTFIFSFDQYLHIFVQFNSIEAVFIPGITIYIFIMECVKEKSAHVL